MKASINRTVTESKSGQFQKSTMGSVQKF